MIIRYIEHKGFRYRWLGNGSEATGKGLGWSMSKDLYFGCVACGYLMNGAPNQYDSCECGKLHKDSGMGRFGSSLGDDAIEVYARVHESNAEIIVKAEIEKLLFKYGFEPAVVQLAQATVYGQKEIYCYRRDELYCCIEFTLHPTIHGELREWVLIEYANSLYEAERWMFEDGDMFLLEIPVEEIICGLEQELIRVVDFD